MVGAIPTPATCALACRRAVLTVWSGSGRDPRSAICSCAALSRRDRLGRSCSTRHRRLIIPLLSVAANPGSVDLRADGPGQMVVAPWRRAPLPEAARFWNGRNDYFRSPHGPRMKCRDMARRRSRSGGSCRRLPRVSIYTGASIRHGPLCQGLPISSNEPFLVRGQALCAIPDAAAMPTISAPARSIVFCIRRDLMAPCPDHDAQFFCASAAHLSTSSKLRSSIDHVALQRRITYSGSALLTNRHAQSDRQHREPLLPSM